MWTGRSALRALGLWARGWGLVGALGIGARGRGPGICGWAFGAFRISPRTGGTQVPRRLKSAPRGAGFILRAGFNRCTFCRTEVRRRLKPAPQSYSIVVGLFCNSSSSKATGGEAEKFRAATATRNLAINSG